MTMREENGAGEGGAVRAFDDSPQAVAQSNAAIASRFASAQSVLIVSHIRPDGDAVGSLLGLGLSLRAAGKQVHLALADGVPHNFRHLMGSDQVAREVPAALLKSADLAVVVDCSDLQRTGGLLGERKPDINIDHHVTNLAFAGLNLVLPVFEATAGIITEYLPAWGLPYNTSVADALLTGIITDTIGFRTSNMTPLALRQAAMLMELGSNLPELYARALTSKTFNAAQYWGQGLSRIQQETVKNGSTECMIVWTSLTLADRRAASYPGNDDADLVNVLASIEGDVALIFVEQKNNHTKVSWRARPGIDVSQIALQFGGGGHPAAAGADIPGALDEVQTKVLNATRTLLMNRAE